MNHTIDSTVKDDLDAVVMVSQLCDLLTQWLPTSWSVTQHEGTAMATLQREDGLSEWRIEYSREVATIAGSEQVTIGNREIRATSKEESFGHRFFENDGGHALVLLAADILSSASFVSYCWVRDEHDKHKQHLLLNGVRSQTIWRESSSQSWAALTGQSFNTKAAAMTAARESAQFMKRSSLHSMLSSRV